MHVVACGAGRVIRAPLGMSGLYVEGTRTTCMHHMHIPRSLSYLCRHGTQHGPTGCSMHHTSPNCVICVSLCDSYLMATQLHGHTATCGWQAATPPTPACISPATASTATRLPITHPSRDFDRRASHPSLHTPAPNSQTHPRAQRSASTNTLSRTGLRGSVLGRSVSACEE